ncbi:calcium-dependent kinase-like protein [Raphidocelis subcapitata]|uniref:Calcium-dependent kinase-like protein n=1 Tax=Raphidocelis subcapitata TaxID=307507 RepID=A0A2V0NKF7_9CHLO|nr:calcium-dependent kinase-like protein [Raphidocelis subcapitata]|eukprot:GBF87804.1 calcium-dependent kinase-like protein [Raphidocelis subcapitata]
MGACLAKPQVEGEDPLPAGAGSGGGKKHAAHDSKASASAAFENEPEIAPHVAGSEPSLLEKSLLGGARTTDVTVKYDLGEVLGRGAYGTTRRARDRETSAAVAVKSMTKARLCEAGDGGDVRRELDVMLHLSGHPNVVELLDSFEDSAYVHLVMELCTGGDLVHRLSEKGSYTERDAAAIIRTVLKVLEYAHDLGVAHRDIKPDNCLLKDDSDEAAIKVCDWGFAAFVRPDKPLTALCGTCYYCAPEVVMGAYDERADVWSAGAMLYVLLCGRPPFYALRDEDVLRKVVDDGVPNMTGAPWPSISEGAKDAVRQMMTFEPSARPSARQMLAQEWVREGGAAGDNELQPEVLHRMRSFAAMGKFKRAAAMVIATHLPYDEIRGLRELFESIDTDGSGTLTAAELQQALASRGAKVALGELQELVEAADLDGDGLLDYNEFLAVTLRHKHFAEKDNLAIAFKQFDTDGDGFLSRAELRAALKAAGHAHAAGPDAVLRAADATKDGRLGFEEFAALMASGTAPAKEGGGPANGGGGKGGASGKGGGAKGGAGAKGGGDAADLVLGRSLHLPSL